MVQGVPRAASTCWWLVDRQDMFQIELFEFRSPLVRPLPQDWRPCDVGYTTVSFWVADLDRAIERATEAGTPPLTQPTGPSGARRACVRDPEGVLIELMEEDPREEAPRKRPRPEIGAAARSVTLSVPDLERSREFFADVLGMQVAAGLALHGPEHEALWGLDGARRESLSLWADDMIVELVEYAEPRGRPWAPGYRITDQGLLNIAFGFRERAEFEAAYRRCEEAGLRGNGPPVRLGAWSVVYVNDSLGYSVELLHVEPWYEGRMGFRPRPSPSFAPFVGRTRGGRAAPACFHPGAGHRGHRGSGERALPPGGRGRDRLGAHGSRGRGPRPAGVRAGGAGRAEHPRGRFHRSGGRRRGGGGAGATWRSTW